jgi:hypothetical protein
MPAATLRPETMYGQTNAFVLPTGTALYISHILTHIHTRVTVFFLFLSFFLTHTQTHMTMFSHTHQYTHTHTHTRRRVRCVQDGHRRTQRSVHLLRALCSQHGLPGHDSGARRHRSAWRDHRQALDWLSHQGSPDLVRASIPTPFVHDQDGQGHCRRDQRALRRARRLRWYVCVCMLYTCVCAVHLHRRISLAHTLTHTLSLTHTHPYTLSHTHSQPSWTSRTRSPSAPPSASTAPLWSLHSSLFPSSRSQGWGACAQ